MNRLDHGATDNGGAAAIDAAVEATMEQAAGQPANALTVVRHIGDRTFYRRKQTWYQAGYDARNYTLTDTIVAGSDTYIRTIERNPRLAKFLALGNVVLEVDGAWLKFGERG